MKKSKLGLGLVVGGVAGAIAGALLSPKSGKEMRKDAKKLSKEVLSRAKKIQKELEEKDPEEAIQYVFGKVSANSKKIYETVKAETAVAFAQLRENYKEVDTAKYKKVINAVVEKARVEKNLPDEQVKKLISYLEGDLKKLAGKKPAKKSARKPLKKSVGKLVKKTAKKTLKKVSKKAS